MLQHHRIQFVLTLCLILLMSVVPVTQAAPPLQGGSTDGTSLGDSLNLNEDGTPVDEVESGGNNLGTVMSDKEDETIEDDTPDDGTTDDSTTDEDTTEDGTTDDGTTDEDTTDDGTTEEVIKQHPVATALAGYFEVEYDEIMTLHEDGYGFGNIAKAYFFADQLGLTPQDLLLEAHDSGWGNVLKENGIHPGAVGKGGGKKSDVTEPENPTTEEPQGGATTDLTGQGGGNGHGNGGGNGHGGGNGGGNGHSDDHGGGNGNGGGKGHGGGNGGGKGNK
jgi:hypothetical protein